ncbi:B9 domain-containing protein, putative [Bodo saltans]|uniref:B9 domain-containing protein 1 n=2 Tax=Bodo saltans TaxID=75058 RepID=A0A0S4JU44_BODSA|nr:B9 domain-containing protein, putative [Bodo saltans]|eukprot:CUG92079.1 B9 domain-containing protein, putative [Bodo saltans]
MTDITGGFEVTVHGTIEGAECLEASMLYARSVLVMGKDWGYAATASGERADHSEVVTQMSERLPGPQAKFSWNAPFAFALKSSNLSGWPQLAIAVSTLQRNGKDSPIGYARCHVPFQRGRKTLDLPLMQPVHSTPQHSLHGSLTGSLPELRDMTFLCSGEDRVVMSAKRLPGYVRVSFDVVITGLEEHGYSS